MDHSHMPSSALLEVGKSGICRPMQPPSQNIEHFPQRDPYRFCRFLCDLEDLVETVSDDCDRIRIAALLVQRLLAQAHWIMPSCPEPEPNKGLAIQRLYREPGYPFTIKLVSWLPGIKSPVHNHAAWSIVAIIGDATCGHERNQFWHRQDDGRQPDYAQLQPAEQHTLKPGNILGLMPDAIHSVEQLSAPHSQKPTYTFNVYGKADLKRRYIFDPATNRLKNH
ncbi:3-mercaptopropionate dioxygenase [Acaryochloris thomasi RCC1774]|uniref:3-mercaptopropionate dioxygenase n=1 Tax=Acaryochloris thomasi RCC1774 TaxID=1764569 RepID=A0A2W1JIG2_9CYAN|nr:cupin [Acaryochloris thomasi]PZD73293.1 3-mercaptopropionate dioxygenase [Acaryochloris thomasi RCC1774]